ncbi:hypothetical protein ACLXBB_36910, partial [Pseudomonas aeruginosa]
PFGRHAGALSTVRPDDLAGLLLARLAETSGFAVDDLEDVILGCTNQAGEDSRNLSAGMPVHSRRCVRTTWPACCWRVSRKPPGSPS